MRATGLFSVWLLVTAAPWAWAEGHASARSFQAPESTMSDTTRAAPAAPRAASRGAATWQTFSQSPMQQQQQEQQTSGTRAATSGSGSSGSSSGNTAYKANEAAQKQIAESGAKASAAAGKMGTESVTATAAQTDNFLKGLANIPRPSENFDSFGSLASRVGSTAGSGQTGSSFDALVNEKNQVFKTGEQILMQIGARQLATQLPPTAVPTPEPIPISQRISAALASGRPTGNGLNYVPRGMEVGASTPLNSSISGIR